MVCQKLFLMRLMLAALIISAAGCGTVAIKSTPPEAEIMVMVPGKEAMQPLGKTPYTADLDELEQIVNEGTIIIVVQKQGYVPKQFVVPNLGGGKLDIETTLTPNLPTDYREVNKIISLTLKAERLLLQKQFDEALKAAAEIRKINDNVATAYEVEGTVHFLENRLEKSRFAWIRALELDPDNPEAQNMLSMVEKRMNITGRAPTPPASGSPK